MRSMLTMWLRWTRTKKVSSRDSTVADGERTEQPIIAVEDVGVVGVGMHRDHVLDGDELAARRRARSAGGGRSAAATGAAKETKRAAAELRALDREADCSSDAVDAACVARRVVAGVRGARRRERPGCGPAPGTTGRCRTRRSRPPRPHWRAGQSTARRAPTTRPLFLREHDGAAYRGVVHARTPRCRIEIADSTSGGGRTADRWRATAPPSRKGRSAIPRLATT